MTFIPAFLEPNPSGRGSPPPPALGQSGAGVAVRGAGLAPRGNLLSPAAPGSDWDPSPVQTSFHISISHTHRGIVNTAPYGM